MSRTFAARAAASGLAVAAFILGGCSSASRSSAGPATTATTVAPPRKLTVPDQPCSLLAPADLNVVLPGAQPIPRPSQQTPTMSSAGCAWRLGANSLDVEVLTTASGDLFQSRAVLLKKPTAIPGLGDRAVESDNLGVSDPTKRISVLVGSGNAVIEVTARVFGQVSVGRVQYAAQTALSHLTGN